MVLAKDKTVLQEVISIFESTLRLPSGKLEADANFEDIGMDSIISMELLSNISKKFNISISPSKLTDINTVRELAVLLEKEMLGNNVVEVKSTAVKPEVVKENLPTEKRIEIQPTVVRTRQTQTTRQSRPGRAGNGSYQNLLQYVNQKYNIDLSYRSFASVDDIVDTLLSNHTNDLLSHFETYQHPGKLSGKEFHLEENDLTSKDENDYKLPRVQDIAIVGVSCNFPDAPNAQIFWDNLINQKISIREIPQSRWNWEDFYAESVAPGKTVSKWGALLNEVDQFDAKFFNITPEEAALMDPQERLLMQEVYKALQDGGIDPAKLKGTKTGVFVSYEYSEYEHYVRNNIDRIPVGPTGPFFSSSSPSYFLANRLSFAFDFYGPSESINVNCAGSAVAINRAYYSLLNGESDVAVIGGVSLNMFAGDYVTLSNYGMLSPNGTCGVFDDDANGFTRGEGVASVILKRLDDAERDNNKIYGVIKCSHQKNRGNARFLQEIKTESFTSVIKECYEKASVQPETVRYIEVDGYATKWGDSFEFDGIKNAFGRNESNRKYCALGSAKGNVGNLEAVSGLTSFIKLSLSLYNKKFPPTISKKKTNVFFDIENPSHPLYIADSTISFETIRENNALIRAGINSFADSGVNVHILLEEYNIEHDSKHIETGSPQLFILSAKDRARLDEYVQEYINFISAARSTSFDNMIYTLQTGREAMDERLAIVASSYTELLEKLNLFKKLGAKEKNGLGNKGIFHGNIKQVNDNPLLSLFTKDMARQLVAQSLITGQWQQIAQVWISGLEVQWEMVWKNKQVQIASLPFYPFVKERHWINLNDKGDSAVVKNKAEKEIKKDIITEDKNESSASTHGQAEWFFFMANGDVKDAIAMNSEEKTELFLKQEIALSLNQSVSNINIDLNYLELGMNSLSLLTFLSRVNSLLQVNISPGLLFIYPDIKKLTGHIVATFPEKIKKMVATKDQALAENFSANATTSESTVVSPLEPAQIILPMQTKGKGKPVFMVPGADGSVLVLQHLISALGEDQPLYGLESVGLDGKTPPLKSVKETAEFNIAAMRTIQPSGPYRILGYSAGGVVAFEMARILLEQKEKVGNLYIIDTLSPLLPVKDMLEDIGEVFKSLFVGQSGNELDLNVEQLKQLPENEVPVFLNSAIRKNGFDWPQEHFLALYDVITSNEKNCRAYSPSKITDKIDVILFRAMEGYLKGYENLPADYGWNQLLAKPIQVHIIHGNHFSMVNKEHSLEIANVMKSALTSTVSKKKASSKI
jgi:thioesterase domain-containing protein/3-oxoacyl-(acyl-carrier-protein) synthase/acyl carrier protein